MLNKIRNLFGSKILRSIEDRTNWFTDAWWSFWSEMLFWKESIGRFFYWGWKMKTSHDWDHSYLYDVMLLKTKRMLRCFEEHGNGTWTVSNVHDPDYDKEEYKRLKALKLTIKLIERVRNDCYHDIHDDIMDNRYGDLTICFENEEKTDTGTTCELIARRDGIPVDELPDKGAYEKDRKDRYLIGERRKQRDMEIIGKLMAKYSLSWWD